MKSKFLFLIVGLLSLPILSYSQENINTKDLTDREILEIFYNATGGDNWTNNTNWLSDEPLNDWYGITAENENVLKIDINSNNLSGFIPDEIYLLDELTVLILSNNSLFGEIQNEIENLQSLKILFLNSLGISGQIPSEIGSLSNLEKLVIHNNYYITGAIPIEIGNLDKLDSLVLSGLVNLESIIPSELGNLSNLKYLDLSLCSFHGSIPSELFDLPNLEILDLTYTGLEGSIPSNIGNLTNIRSIKIQECNLTGLIPSTIGNLNNLQQLWLMGNLISGTIPSEIGNLFNLEDLRLSRNKLQGSIPSSIGNLTNLNYLYLSYNEFSGEIPAELGQLTNLYQLLLRQNQLTGEIPFLPNDFHYLYQLNFENNNLDAISSGIENLTINEITFFGNLFTFEDISNCPNNAVYSPQKTIPLNDTIRIKHNETINYELPFDQEVENSTYQWFKNGELYETTTVGELELNAPEENQTNYYHLQITNTDFPELILETDSLVVIHDVIVDFDYELFGCESEVMFYDLSYNPNLNIVDWNWNFGDPLSEENNISDLQNPTHLFVENKNNFEIKLVVTYENGTTDSIIEYIQLYSAASVSGNVTTDLGTLITDGFVIAYYVNDGLVSTVADSVAIQEDGSYTLTNLFTCVDYLIKGFVSSDIYEDILPGYYESAFYWEEATIVTVSFEQNELKDINLVLYELVPPIMGSARISGGVYYRDYKGQPVKNVDVILEYDAPDDKVFEISGYQKTNNLGEWTFEGLSEGFYKIKLDLPSLIHDSVYFVNIAEPDQEIIDLNYYVDIEEGIFSEISGIQELNQNIESIFIFPNPTNDVFNIEITALEDETFGISQIKVFDVHGRLIHLQTESFRGTYYNSKVTMEKWPKGVYIIKIIGKEVNIVKKLMKN